MNGNDIVLSCRVRLARNVSGLPFVHRMKLDQASSLVSCVYEAFSSSGEYRLMRMVDVGDNDRMMLVERHLCSKELINSPKGALIVNKNDTLAIMINEEDHLRIQAILPGLNLPSADKLSKDADEIISGSLAYAFDDKLGYLTACPTNVGTGMRASAMLHLAGLGIAKQAGGFLTSVMKLGFSVRGFYGENTNAPGHIYQISNQATLGVSEDEILSSLEQIITRISEQELQLRRALAARNPVVINDLVLRSYGVCAYAQQMSYSEFMTHISNLKLGVSLGILPGLSQNQLNRLLQSGQKASLNAREGKLLNPPEEAIRRAVLVRQCMREKKE